VDDDVGLEVSLRGGERELNDTDFSVLNAGGATGEVTGFLVYEDKAVDELGIVDSAADFLSNVDVVEVSVSGGLHVYDLEDGVDGDGGKEVRVVGDDLGGEGGDRVLNKLFAVVQVHGFSHAVNDLVGLVKGDHEAV
jgi:hypothetical protein